MRRLLVMVAMAVAVLAWGSSARAESLTLSSNGSSTTFACANGCFGNDITLDVSGAGTNWTVTLTFDTDGNTNAGSSIIAVAWILDGFDFADANLTGAPGGAGAWTEQQGPANAGGCNGSTANSTCAEDTSVVDTGTSPDASPLGGNLDVYVWTWTITGATFGGFDADTHIQALFGDMDTGCSPDCIAQTGLISTGVGGEVPEPGTIALLGTGLVGLAAMARRRLARFAA